MPDPQRDLAPIIELPAAKPSQVAHSHLPVESGLVAAGLLLVGLSAWWYWRRTTPLRKLRRLARTSASPRVGADALAVLMAARPAVILDPAWHRGLERLRFGRSGPDDAEVLARLCREAAAALRRRR